MYRKSICQFDVFERFDDIAGVRCTCEFLSDVYDVLSYIRENPLFRVYDIEDIIEKPSKTGYRGIHVIVTTDVYYHGSLYKDINILMHNREFKGGTVENCFSKCLVNENASTDV